MRRGLGVGDLFSLFRILQHLDPDVPLAALLEDGSQAVASPEHPAEPREIQRSALALGRLLASGSVRPRLVTIARSVEDGFTPPSDWPFIEWTVLDALRDALGDYRLRYDEGIQAAPRPASR